MRNSLDHARNKIDVSIHDPVICRANTWICIS
jgi:hypothetical protein